jgi:hypothetical protein
MSRFGRCVSRVDLALERVAERVRSVVVDRGELSVSLALFVGYDLGEVRVDACGVELLDGVDLAEECGAKAQQGAVKRVLPDEAGVVCLDSRHIAVVLLQCVPEQCAREFVEDAAIVDVEDDGFDRVETVALTEQSMADLNACRPERRSARACDHVQHALFARATETAVLVDQGGMAIPRVPCSVQ